jgi:hypothetical protein
LSFYHHRVAMAVDGEALAEAAGFEYQYVMDCGSVVRAYDFSSRDEKLSFKHHRMAMAAPTLEKRLEWLRRANAEGWSAARLLHGRRPCGRQAGEGNARSRQAENRRGVWPPA